MKKIQLPSTQIELETAYKELVERLVECQELSLDAYGHPYWGSCGKYLDGKRRYDDNDNYHPDGIIDVQ